MGSCLSAVVTVLLRVGYLVAIEACSLFELLLRGLGAFEGSWSAFAAQGLLSDVLVFSLSFPRQKVLRINFVLSSMTKR
jgi:hypothetical protein